MGELPLSDRDDDGDSQESVRSEDARAARREFFTHSSAWLALGGLASGYGILGAMAARYLFPDEGVSESWQYVARVADVGPGDALTYVSPSGAQVVIARQGDSGEVSDFVALSSVCPHLGCQVFWQAARDRFFCPCHNGAFDASGRPLEGPPARANQALTRFDLQIDGGLLFVLAPLSSIRTASLTSPGGTAARDAAAHGLATRPGGTARREA